MDGRFVARAITRRGALRLGGGAMAAALLPNLGLASAQVTASISGETFVGVAVDGETYIAVIVGESAGYGSKRPVRAYVCDAPRIDVWFVGEAEGDSASLEAEDGSRLSVELRSGAVAGWATLVEGVELAFEVAQAEGPAGFYPLVISAEGAIAGDAADGHGRLEGWVFSEPVTRDDGSGEVYPVVSAIVPDEGEPVAILGAVSVREASELCRLIVQPDGLSKGAGKVKESRRLLVWRPSGRGARLVR
ncbi:MAG: hypothetical protein IT336_09790 [Thermomicrobiales bacterium]|nr:hypothetical protein [Thermomicrobiales bacterium]